MSGGGRRGRRGGRRQRRREQQRNGAAAESQAPQTNGQSVAAHVVMPQPETVPLPSAAAAHPRPMSARELVAKLEARRAEAEHASHPQEREPRADEDPLAAETVAQPDAWAPRVSGNEPRRFVADGVEYIARRAGVGAGGTGRVAQARIEAIRFARADEPDAHVAEVLLPGAHLERLYDEELAALLVRGLRSRTEHG